MGNTDKVIVTWREIAAYLGCSVSCARLYVNRGLPVYRACGVTVAFTDELEKWIKENGKAKPGRKKKH